MKKSKVAVSLSVAALIGALLAPTFSFAQASKFQNMLVQAQVNVNCNFTSTPTTNFPSYDPADVNALPANPLVGSVVVDVRCTRGATVTIGIDNGANGPAAATLGLSTRAMKSGTFYLAYDFYKDTTYTTPWTNSSPGWYSFTSGSNASTSVPIYGRVPGGQDIPAGTYQDTVQVTVNY